MIGFEGFLQEVPGRAGEAEALGGQALAPGYACHHGRARTDDALPQGPCILHLSFSR